MLTIFACPKPFSDPHINIIQRNAIKSWTLLNPKPEIILIGNEKGVAEICKELDLLHIPEVERNEYGTPYINSIFKKAERNAKNDIMCYVNCDIILMSDFMSAIMTVVNKFNDSKFLIVGKRWDVDIKKELNFQDDWENQIKAYVKKNGKLHSHTGIDFFVFNKGQYSDIISFLIGRPMWDNWLIFESVRKKIPVIDISYVAVVIHQNHDYSHQKWSDPYKNPETEYNLKLAGGYKNAFTILDAQYKLTNKGVTRNFSFYGLYYKIKRFLRNRIFSSK